MALATFGPLSPTKIAERLNMQKGSLSSVLRRLERLGLIARRRSATDDRSYTTALTPDGADLAEHLSRDRQRSVDLLFSTMDPADVGVAARGLELI
ncbi:MAG: MarR family transcriptional regulator, partial [Maritimibacter sp.]|nr:MarR family transcriptional regulator [Maritimibacter sp.]